MPAIPLAEDIYSDPSREMRAAVSTALEDATKASAVNSSLGHLDDLDEEVYSRLIVIAMFYFGVSFLPIYFCCKMVYICRVSRREGMRSRYERNQMWAKWPSAQGWRPVSLIFTFHFWAFIIAHWSNTTREEIYSHLFLVSYCWFSELFTYICMVCESLECAEMQYLSSVKNNQDVENIKQVAHTRPQVNVHRLRVSYCDKDKCTIQELERPFTFPFWEVNSEPVWPLIAKAVGATTTIRVREYFFFGDAEICARHAEVARESLKWNLPQNLPQPIYHGKIRTVAATPGVGAQTPCAMYTPVLRHALTHLRGGRELRNGNFTLKRSQTP